MSDFQQITVNGHDYIVTRAEDSEEEIEGEWEEDFADQCEELIANESSTKESPLPDLEVFGDDEAELGYVEIPTINQEGEEAPLQEIDMDWSSMGSGN